MEMRKTWRLSDMSTVAQLVFPVGYLGNTLEVVGTITQAFRWWCENAFSLKVKSTQRSGAVSEFVSNMWYPINKFAIFEAPCSESPMRKSQNLLVQG